MLLKFFSRYLYVAMFIFCLSANAATVDVTAEYKPAVYEDARGTFKSTTACQRLTELMTISQCNGNVVSLDSLLFSFKNTIKRTVARDFKDQKDSFIFLGSSGKKMMTIKSEKGTEFTVDFIPDQLGAHVSSSIEPDEGLNFYYNSIIKPSGGCKYIAKSAAGNINISKWIFLWGNIDGKSCYTATSVEPHDGLYTADIVLFGFKIRPPSPLDMPNGIYRGSLTLSMGKNGDISFGNGTYSDSQLVINLTLTVRHQLKVDFPKGDSDGHSQVTLLPPGGWMNWIHSGKREPNLLQQDLPFRIWFSAPFTLALRCQHQLGTECGLKNGKGRTVPLKVYYVNSSRVMTLLTTNKLKLVLPSRGIQVNAARAIRFQVAAGTVAEMMKYPGSSFKGDVTLIFDAAID